MKTTAPPLLRAFPIIFLFAFLLSLFSCEKWDLEQTVFDVLTEAPVSTGTYSATITGEVRGLAGRSASQHGHVWSIDGTLPTLITNAGFTNEGVIERDATFESTLENLLPQAAYTFRAYVIVGEEIRYSDPITYATGSATLTTSNLNYQTGRSLTIAGAVTGLGANVNIIQHGHVWAAGNTTPTLADAATALGRRFEDGTFTSVATSLEDGKAYTFRSYAILNLPESIDTIYGNPLEFQANLINFWGQGEDFPLVGDYPGRIDARSFTIGNNGYVVGGYYIPDVSPAPAFSLQDMHRYNPESGWSYLSDVEFGEPFDYFVITVVDDKAYAVSLKGAWEFDPSQSSAFVRILDEEDIPLNWNDPENGLPNAIIGDFAIDGKIYYVLNGYLGITGYPILIFDPATRTFESNKDLNAPNIGAIQFQPPFSSISFSLDNKGYFGLGVNQFGSPVNRMIAFDPQSGWSEVAPFPGAIRSSAVSFNLNDKFFYGSGVGSYSGQLRTDFYTYDPQNGWQEAPPLPANQLGGATAFSIGKRGFVTTGVDNLSLYRNELWIYTAQ